MVYLPIGSSGIEYRPSWCDTVSRFSWVELSTAVMCVCPNSPPDESVTAPVKALRSTCENPGIAKERKNAAERKNKDGERGERKEQRFGMLGLENLNDY